MIESAPSSAGSRRMPVPPLWLLVLVTINASVAVHLFVPAMPSAAVALHTSASGTQMAISLFLLAVCSGQLVCGPLADAWGRRPVLLGGLALFALGSIGASLAVDLPTLLAARIVQALGASCGMTLGRVIVRDTTQGEETVRRLALLAMMIMLSPGLAPLLGGLLVSAFGWRAVFVALALTGSFALWMARTRMPETGTASGRLAPRRVLADYAELLRSRRYFGVTIGAGAFTTSIFAFVATAPFVLTHDFQLPVAYTGIVGGLVMMGFVVGSALTSLIVQRVGASLVIAAGMSAATSSASVLLAIELWGHCGLPLLIGLMIVFTMGIGMSSAALMAKAISLRPSLVASAAGLYGATQMGMGTVTTALAAAGDDPAQACTRTLLGMALLGCACVWYGLRQPAPGEPASSA